MALKKDYKRSFLSWFSQLVTGIVFTGLYYVAPDKTIAVEYAKLSLGLLSMGIGISFLLIPKISIENGVLSIYQTMFRKKKLLIKDIKSISYPSSKQIIEIDDEPFHCRDIDKDDFDDLKKVLDKLTN